MSIPSLPEWKRLLLDRKRKGEETRERQVREDEKRLANMPAWKREVIQRRKAKQEGDGGPQTVDGFRNGPEPQSQVSVENIGPVQHNPFVLSQNVWRGDRRECREDLGPDNSAEGGSGPEKVMEGEGESRIGLGSRWEAYAREEEDMQGKERKMEEGGRRELERALRVREVVDQQQVSREGKETVISTGSERVGKIQRGPCVYTSSSLGVIQEVGLPKPSPPLPANVSPSQLLLAAKAEARASSAATPVAAASPHIQERQEQERQHVEDSESSQKGRRFTEEGGKEEEECAQSPSPSLTTSIDVPPSSSSPTLPFVVNMSRIYNQKPVVPRSTLSIGERKTENMSPTLKAQGRESPLQSHRLPLTSFTVNPKSSPVLENPPQIQECKDVVTPSASLSPSSSSPSALPNAPLFSLRNTSAGPGKRGNTITIVPRRPPAAGKPATDPGANRTAPQTQAPISGDASKKRYPTVEEIVVIGGYKKVEKSCLSKHGKTPKGVSAQLEHVCEYPSESAMLASLPCPPPDSEKEAEEKMGGQEEEEEEEEETGAFALSSKRMAVGKSRVLRVG
uniref:Protein phosphatase 1 regulatory subunit 18 n=1 Tax=Paramormyrops kingsleyae TaxID=1676925 RepID=A0A3B3SJ17_9TELE